MWGQGGGPGPDVGREAQEAGPRKDGSSPVCARGMWCRAAGGGSYRIAVGLQRAELCTKRACFPGSAGCLTAGKEVRVQVPPAERGRPGRGVPSQRHRLQLGLRHLRYGRCDAGILPAPFAGLCWLAWGTRHAGGSALWAGRMGAAAVKADRISPGFLYPHLLLLVLLCPEPTAQAATAWSTSGTAPTRSG